jgi:hypothetical protein
MAAFTSSVWIGATSLLVAGMAVSNHKLLALLAMLPEVLDRRVGVKGEFLTAHPSQ